MKSQLLTFLLLILGWGNGLAQSCLPEGIIFSTQEQIDNFSINYPGCTEILGAVIIEETSPGEITNLLGLNQLTTIDSLLRIYHNSALTSLAGLDALESITGDLVISTNPNLLSLTGLESLTSLGVGGLKVWSNESLSNLIGLEQLHTVAEVNIKGNEGLTHLTGLNSLNDSLSGNLHLWNNDALQNLSALEGLRVAKEIYLRGNASLKNLKGLDSITTINEFLVIEETKLENLMGLNALTTIMFSMEITQNPLLESIAGLESLSSVITMEINQNDELESLAGLEQMVAADGLIELINNPKLSNLSGLSNLSSVGELKVLRNDLLTNLTGLESLVTVEKSILIRENDGLLNLTGLESLATTNVLRIENNGALESVQGLNALTTVNQLDIESSPLLTDLSGLENLTEIQEALFLWENTGMTSLEGLNNLTQAGNISVVNGTNLQTVSGLENLQTLSGTLLLFNCSNLNSLTGLLNLTSIGGGLQIDNNDSLQTLAGLELLQSIGGLRFENLNNLQQIDALSNVDFVNTTQTMTFGFNSNLSLCGYDNLCDYIINGGDVSIYPPDVAPCSSVSAILASCYQDADHLVGKVVADVNDNCLEEEEEVGIHHWLINAETDEYSITVYSREDGTYWLPLIDGDWTINAYAPNNYWLPCFTDSLVQTNGGNDTINTNFLFSSVVDCPFVEWEMNMPDLRVCTDRNFVFNYCNWGVEPIDDLSFSVQLDSFLIFQSATVPYTLEPDGSYLFEVDTLEMFECGQFSFTAFVDCDSFPLGEIQCVEVEVLPDDLCVPNSLWDGSTIMTSGYCANDSIHFEIENIGTGNMSQPSQFKVEIVIDDIVMVYDVDDYQLNAGATEMLTYPLSGDGMRLETNQALGHPVSALVSTVVPNCEDETNNAILNLLPMNDGDPFMETYCGEVVGSYDPNIKTVLPEGLGDAHEIDKSWSLDYTIQFQNTGTDTAFLVVIRDTISENLDLTSLSVRGASHPFTWKLMPNRDLVFTFENILLPDSTTNEPASHGFVQYTISPKTDLLPGSIIENRAGIYFDYNEPIITNTVFHTIRKPVVTSSERIAWCAGVDYFGMPIWQDTTIQNLTDLLHYDSIHFVHFEVIPQIQSEVFAEVLIGEYYEDILILGDTTFTLNYVDQLGCDSIVNVTVSGLTDVDEIEAVFRDIKIFPNPVDDFLTVLEHQNGSAQEWTLHNNLGQRVWNRQLMENERLPQIPMNNHPSGVYLLQVKTAGQTVIWKVLRL